MLLILDMSPNWNEIDLLPLWTIKSIPQLYSYKIVNKVIYVHSTVSMIHSAQIIPLRRRWECSMFKWRPPEEIRDDLVVIVLIWLRMAFSVSCENVNKSSTMNQYLVFHWVKRETLMRSRIWTSLLMVETRLLTNEKICLPQLLRG